MMISVQHYFFIILYFSNVFGYNLDTNFPIIYKDPIHNASERSSYFGYSVLLSSSWIQIGAPRGNFSRNEKDVKEPGVAYHCKFNEPCLELSIGKTTSKNSFSLSKGSWFGVAMDFEPRPEGDIVVCGHRWMNATQTRGIPGACFWFKPNQNLHSISNILTPTASVEKDKRLYMKESNSGKKKAVAYKYQLSQSGASIHFSGLNAVEKTLLLGAPGYFNWKGSVVKCKDLATCTNEPAIIEPLYNPEIGDFDLFGYTVSSGYFFSPHELMYVAGAPRDASMKGYVLLYKFPTKTSKLDFVLKIHGESTGEYFGSSIAVADITGDGLDDMVVGAPFFTQNGDEGRIYIFEFHTDKTLKKREFIQGKKEKGRFGTAVASLGDLDHDSFADIAVGAPYEDNGVIYIYYGGYDGLNGQYQRISAEEIYLGLKGFGSSFSGRADVDGNKYNDVAVGSFLSGHAVILRTRPVVTLNAFIHQETQQLTHAVRKATIRVCLHYTGINVPTLNVTRIIIADNSYKRANPPSMVDYLTLHVTNNTCNNVTFSVMFNEDLKHHSMKFVLKAYISNTTNTITKQSLLVGHNGTKSGDDRFHLQDPLQRVLEGSPDKELEIPYSLDCKSVICQTDLTLKCSLLKDGKLFNTSQPFIIGSPAKYQLNIKVVNSGEPSYTTNVEVKFSKEIRLASMPLTCSEKKETVVCQMGLVGNRTEDAKNITLDLDMLSVGQWNTGDNQDLHIDANVTTSGSDVNETDNFKKMSLKLSLDVDAHIYGKSQRDNYPVFKLDNGSFASVLDIVQIHEIHKKGTSPLKMLELQIKVPVTITTHREEIQILSLYNPESVIDSKHWDCRADYGCIDCEITSSREIEDSDSLNIRMKRSVLQNDLSAETTPPPNRTLYINCSTENVKCTLIRCLPTELEAYGKVTLRMLVNVAKLGPLMGQKDIVYISSEGKIQILNPENYGINNIQQKWPHISHASSTIIGKIPKKKVDIWIIVASIIGGILIAMVVAMGLAKAGFFQRQTKADLQELKEKARNSQIQSRPASYMNEEIDTNIELRQETIQL